MLIRSFENEILGVSLSSIVADGGEIYFKAKGVATALGYADPKGAIQKHVSGKHKFEYSEIQGGQIGSLHPQTLLLSEPELYEIIFISHLPAAVACRDWIFSAVIPSIRRTGSYSMNALSLKDQRTNLKPRINELKDPIAVERGRDGGKKAQQNRRHLVEFKNMFVGLYNMLFGPDN